MKLFPYRIILRPEASASISLLRSQGAVVPCYLFLAPLFNVLEKGTVLH